MSFWEKRINVNFGGRSVYVRSTCWSPPQGELEVTAAFLIFRADHVTCIT